jgi:hypothetical protein
MSLVDLFLNLAGLLMWVSWRGISGVESAGSAGTILGNLRPAERVRRPRWGYLAGLLGLLIVRAILYRQLGPGLPWHPSWSVAAVTLSFRSDSFLRMLGYSFMSFGWLLMTWYTWWIAVLVINRSPKDRDGVTRAVRRQLGWLGTLPAPLLAALPPLAAGLAWLAIGSSASYFRLMPELQDGGHLVEQALVMALSQVCVLRWFLVGVLLLHLLNLYVYMGNHAFWDFIQQTGERLARPFAVFRMGHLDLSPLPAAVVMWFILNLLGYGFPWLRHSLPGMPAWLEFGIAPTLFRNLPLH